MFGLLHYMFLVAVCLSRAPRVLGDLEHSCYSHELLEEGGSCGGALDDAVEVFCSFDFKRSGYKQANSRSRVHSYSPGKRYTAIAPAPDTKVAWKERIRELDQRKLINIAKLRNKQLTKRSAMSYLSGISVQNIVCECCQHQCDIVEWQQYC